MEWLVLNIIGWVCLAMGYLNSSEPFLQLVFFIIGAIIFLLALAIGPDTKS